MLKLLNNTKLLFYFILSLFFMEILLNTTTINIFSAMSIFYYFIFSIVISSIVFIICNFFNIKVKYIISLFFTIIMGIIFSSQLIYFKCFKVFYSLYSAKNASQIFEFISDIKMLVVSNFFFILLFFVPTILLIIVRKKIIYTEDQSYSMKKLIIVTLIFSVISHGTGLTTIYTGGKTSLSPYDLYFKSNNPILSVEKLGLMTTMRLQLQRQLSGWSPTYALESLDIPVLSHNKSNTKNTIEEKIEYNTMDIDFKSLLSNESDSIIKDMHKYFSSIQPTEKNEYTGKYKDYNLILITAESFSPYAVDKDLTPTLYKMVHEGYNFTNFYNPLWEVSTLDGEYVACTGLIPKSGVWSFAESSDNYMPFVMGNQLKKQDYRTLAFHNHSYKYYKRHLSHPNMGYTYKGVGNGLNVKKSWPESDVEMMEKTVPEFIQDELFHTYYMTVSGHMQYNFFGNMMAAKNKKYVEELPYSTAGKAYMATQIELDRAMEYLLEQLEKAGIANKTLIAISPDHYPYALKDEEINELAGHEVEKNFELYKSTFILYTKDMKPQTVDKPCSSLDIIPTLSNLLGLEYDSRLLMGKDIFSNSDPLVIFHNRSFITDKGSYNSQTKEFIPKAGFSADDEYIDNISKLVNSKFFFSEKILDTDYYKKILEKD